jgi:hypothetical protein
MSPDISFSFSPNFGKDTYGKYFNSITGKFVEYSFFSGAMYNSVSYRMQAVTRFTLNNNLEMKVSSKKDTITGTKKITIFDNVSISFGYDFAADSLNWEPLRISGRTSLFSFLDVTFGLEFDPYILNEDGENINIREAQVNKKWMRFSNSNLNIGVNWRLNRDFFKSKKKNEKSSDNDSQQEENIFPVNSMGVPNVRPDFSNPWNVTVNYTFAYLTFDNIVYYKYLTGKKHDNNIVQTINVRADLSITRKWKIEITTGYDIKQRDFSFTQIGIYRDLHCWEMSFNWVPFGYRQGWEFRINVKAAVLKDLKLNMKSDFRDNIM